MRTDLILFGCLVMAVAWCVVLTVAAKGALRRLDDAEETVARQEATIARQCEALTEAAQTIAMAGLLLPDQVEAWLAERDLEVN